MHTIPPKTVVVSVEPQSDRSTGRLRVRTQRLGVLGEQTYVREDVVRLLLTALGVADAALSCLSCGCVKAPVRMCVREASRLQTLVPHRKARV